MNREGYGVYKVTFISCASQLFKFSVALPVECLLWPGRPVELGQPAIPGTRDKYRIICRVSLRKDYHKQFYGPIFFKLNRFKNSSG